MPARLILALPVCSHRRANRRVRNLDGPDLAELFLVTAVATLLGIRAYLAATGYPQVGVGKLHIAHVLWGGALMLVAILLLLMLIGTRVYRAAAVIGGCGFGAFVDELGKFLTKDNDYFFKPAIALIYAVFVTVFLIVRAVPSRRPPSRAERLAYAYAALTDLAAGRLAERRREHALALLPSAEGDAQAAAVRALLTRPDISPVPAGWSSSLVRFGDALVDRLYRVAAAQPVRRAVLGLFFLLAGGSVVAILVAFVHRGDLTPPLTVTTLGSAVSALVIAALSVLGVLQLLRGARLPALTAFYRASQVSLFFAQFFAFVAVQLLALAGLAINLLVLVTLRVELSLQTKHPPGPP